MKMTHVVKILSVLAFFGLTNFSKCKEGNVLNPNGSDNIAKVRFFNAAPDAPKLAFVVDGKTINADSTAYNAGIDYQTIKVSSDKKTSLGISAKGAILSGDTLQLKTDSTVSYSVFALQEADKALKTSIVVDNLIPPTAGKARIRIANFIPDLSTPFDIEFAAPNAAASTKRDFQNVFFKFVTNFSDFTAGSYDIKVKLSGQTTTVVPAPNAKGVAATFEAGKTYTVVLRGYVNRSNSAGITVVQNK
jgi:Domain of unknown function (DUF4397)